MRIRYHFNTLPLLALLALASALGVAVAVALAAVAMLLAAPAYADGGSLLGEALRVEIEYRAWAAAAGSC